MRIFSDVSKKIWSIDDELLTGTSIDLNFCFRDNDELPVVFDRLSFGYSITLNNKKISEAFRPTEGMSYVSTDQDFIEQFTVNNLVPGKEYVLDVWSENSDDTWIDSFTFIIPPASQPYPSWVFDNETGMWLPPTPFPEDGKHYHWDEESKSWVVVE